MPYRMDSDIEKKPLTLLTTLLLPVVQSAKSAESKEEWQALALCPLCGLVSGTQDQWVRVFSHPDQQVVRLRAYQAMTTQGANLSTHKQDILPFLADLSQTPYGSRITLGTWT